MAAAFAAASPWRAAAALQFSASVAAAVITAVAQYHPALASLPATNTLMLAWAQAVPSVNGVIDGDEIIYRDYCDISVAVATPKGLVVPVLRNADQMSFADVEKVGLGWGDREVGQRGRLIDYISSPWSQQDP